MNRRTDGWTDKVIPIYPSKKAFVCVGYLNSIFYGNILNFHENYFYLRKLIYQQMIRILNDHPVEQL